MKTMLLTEAINQGIVNVGDAEKGTHGDYIGYHPIKTTVILYSYQTGYKERQIFKTELLHWRIEKVGDKFLLLPDNPTNSKLILKGGIGYNCGVSAMILSAKKLYFSSMASEISVVTKEMVDAGISHCKKLHWLGSQFIDNISGHEVFGLHYMDGHRVNDCYLYYIDDEVDDSYGIRPVVSLKPDIKVMISNEKYGDKEKPWIILENSPDSLATCSRSDIERFIEERENSLKRFIKEEKEKIEKLKRIADEMK